MNVIIKVKQLNLPLGEYIICGGAVLAAHNIRKTNDIDLLVTPTLYKQIFIPRLF